MAIRRTLSIVTGLALVALIIGWATIDWRFWYRWHTLPTDPGEWPASFYQPIHTLTGDPKQFFPAAPEGQESIRKDALETAATWADEHNSAALIVLHNGVVQLERYWRDIGPESLFTGRAMTRSLIPPLLAHAINDGNISSLDDRVGQYLPEWENDPRGDITLRQLLHNVSGLENPPLAGDPDPMAKNAQISLSSNFRKAAVSFALENTPGEFFALSNANAQLLGAVLENTTGQSYEDFLNDRLWAPLGAGTAQIYMDRPGGMPAVYCCFRATPRDWLRYGAALLNDGIVEDQRMWPANWTQQMTTSSSANPNYGLQLWVGNPSGATKRPYIQGQEMAVPHGPPIKADNVFFLEGGGYRTMIILPDQGLVILRLGYYHPDWETSALPNLILAGLEP
ncbi:MAG: serine hydrolase domain-containing protein [Lysobacterales bacterium]